MGLWKGGPPVCGRSPRRRPTDRTKAGCRTPPFSAPMMVMERNGQSPGPPLHPQPCLWDSGREHPGDGAHAALPQTLGQRGPRLLLSLRACRAGCVGPQRWVHPPPMQPVGICGSEDPPPEDPQGRCPQPHLTGPCEDSTDLSCFLTKKQIAASFAQGFPFSSYLRVPSCPASSARLRQHRPLSSPRAHCLECWKASHQSRDGGRSPGTHCSFHWFT